MMQNAYVVFDLLSPSMKPIDQTEKLPHSIDHFSVTILKLELPHF